MKKNSKKTQKPEIPVVDVYELSGEQVDKFKLDAEIFNAKVRKSLLHQMVVMHMANQRQGTASTKTRAEVRGGGKKPWRQKGTGRARVGSIRSPLWRGGGIVFGPKPRDFSCKMSKKMKKTAIISGLSAKTKDKEIIILRKDIELNQPKTKEIVKILLALKIYNKKILLIYSKRDENLMRSCRNIKNLKLRLHSDFNTYDVLSSSMVIFSKQTYDMIVDRLRLKKKPETSYQKPDKE